MTSTTLGYAFLGGLLPAFIWLYFLLKEDASNPEPRTLIALTFVAGMAAVPLALPLEHYAKVYLDGNLSVITAWALIEEVLKYAMVATFILWRRAVDEAPDYVIYMITVALGFAAAENMFFLITPLSGGDFANGFFTGNVRFLGSTLLHVVASATIGFALAFSTRYRPQGAHHRGGARTYPRYRIAYRLQHAYYQSRCLNRTCRVLPRLDRRRHFLRGV